MKKFNATDYCCISIVVIYAIFAKCSYDVYKKVVYNEIDARNRSAKENTTGSDHQ